MTDPYRTRYLFLKNRLEELLRKYGPALELPPEEAELLPSWGPVGTLAARQMTEDAFAELMELHRSMLALERSRNGTTGSSALPPTPVTDL